MKKQGAVGLLAVAAVVFVACLGGCYLGIGLSRGHSSDFTKHGGGATHAELHQALALTPQQEEKLIPLEAKAKKREDELRNALNAANADLARILVSERTYSPEVERSVEKIHQAMAKLQKATLEHLFEMEETLTPDQYDQLLQFAGESLPHSH